MKKIRLLYGATISSAFASLCLILLSTSCSKDEISAPTPHRNSISIFTTQIPADTTQNDAQGGIELGVKFRSNIEGVIEALKFYKTAGNNGKHIGQLYSSDGKLLASETFINETDSGWQTVHLAQPVLIVANKTYIAAYHSSLGNYVATSHGLKDSITNGALTALADSTDGPNGLYEYTNTPILPDFSYLSNNYWVDVVLTYPSGE